MKNTDCGIICNVHLTVKKAMCFVWCKMERLTYNKQKHYTGIVISMCLKKSVRDFTDLGLSFNKLCFDNPLP